MRKYLTIFLKLAISLIALLSVVGIIYWILLSTNALDKIDSVADLKETIQGFGIWSRLFFLLLQFLQVTFIPLPSAITTLTGTIIFGPLQSFLLSIAGIFLGSLLAFYLGRKWGKPLARWIAGDSYEKLENNLTKGKYMFFLMLLFPFFPDDMLCLMAGATNMSYRFFIYSILIARPISMFFLCFMGSGKVVPFNGWGIPVWILLVMCLITLMVLSIRKRNEIENFINNLNNKLKLHQHNRHIKKLAIKESKRNRRR